MMRNPNTFPTTLDTPLILQGPCGDIEALSTSPLPNAEQKKITALICHPHPLHGGTMHNKVVHTLSRAFHHCGYATLRFNYRGVGQSKGQFGNYTGEIKDALSIINWLTQIQPNHQIVLAGFSFGAYVAASLCQQVNAQSLVTIAPAVNHKDYIKLLPISCPWLIIHGEKDELVPINQVKEFIKHLHHNCEFKILENSSHFFHKNLIKLRNVIENYLKSLN